MSVEAQAERPPEEGVSVVFLLLLGALGIAGSLVAAGDVNRFAVFAFVFIGWIVSLCLHEWGHAFVAWKGGDHSVVARGYLTLNPLRYANPLMSIGLPLLFLAMGGIGFPGGAVYIKTENLRNALWRAAMSAAGPAMNLVCLVVIGLTLGAIGGAGGDGEADPLVGALALLGFLQATALILNLLPVPGLDGFGILDAVLPEQTRGAIRRISGIVLIAFLVVMITMPQLLAPLWTAALALCAVFGIEVQSIAHGLELFRFWDAPADPFSGV
jgi:Zn-dependent protease